MRTNLRMLLVHNTGLSHEWTLIRLIRLIRGTAQISAKLYGKTTQCPVLVHLSRFRSPKGDSSVGLLSLLNGLRTCDSSPLWVGESSGTENIAKDEEGTPMS